MSRSAGRELFCHGLFPGETARVKVDAVSRQHARAFASLVALELAHPDRRKAACQNHEANGGACSGCALMELQEPAQRALKRVMLEERFGLKVEALEWSPPELGYRHSSKRVALRSGGGLVLGSFARESHDPAPMPGCLVDHPLLVAAFTDAERAANQLAIEPYDERAGSGDLRYVWAKTNGGDVILTLVVGSAQSRARELLPRRLGSLAGVLVSVQSQRNNSLRGEGAELCAGRAEVGIQLLGQQVELGALGFLQPNPAVAALAYSALVAPEGAARAGGELAFDLYAGAGVTTQLLRARYRDVLACEAQPESAARLGVAPESVEDFLRRQLTRSDPKPVDLIVANPPRKGLGAAVSALLRRVHARELRIMSCGPEGLARDLTALCAGVDGYTLRWLRAFDTLPQTPHVELVAALSRA